MDRLRQVEVTARLFVAIAALFVLAMRTDASALPTGQYSVGFHQKWIADASRTYITAMDDGATYGKSKSPRPILVNVWYPANPASNAAPMPHSAYLDLPNDPPDFQPLSRALADYERNVIANETLDTKRADLTDEQRAAFDSLLASPTTCVRSAPQILQHFPLIIYHAGAGSSFEDNAAFCAALASHGYVVVGSAYLKADGSTFNIDANEGSLDDIDILINAASNRIDVDATRIALLGHSAGAQAIFKYATRPNRAIDAIILLDTTQDYYSLALPMFESLVSAVREHGENITIPMLVAAGPEAMFQLCDTVRNARRTYLTLPQLGHNEFVAQGWQRMHTLQSLNALPENDAERFDEAHASYTALCEYILAFLNAELRNDRATLDELTATYSATKLGSPSPHVEIVNASETAPPPYDLNADTFPTPRQFARLFATSSMTDICNLFERFADDEPRSPIYSSSMLISSLLFELLEQDRIDEAREFYTCARKRNSFLMGTFVFLADMCRMNHKPESARRMLETAQLLEPDDADVADRLKQLDAPQDSAPH